MIRTTARTILAQCLLVVCVVLACVAPAVPAFADVHSSTGNADSAREVIGANTGSHEGSGIGKTDGSDEVPGTKKPSDLHESDEGSGADEGTEAGEGSGSNKSGEDSDQDKLTKAEQADKENLEAVIRAYQQFNELLTYEPEWNGDAKTCLPGTTNGKYIGATLEAINLFRNLAGMKPVGLSDSFNHKAQAAALTMYASNQLSHEIDDSFTCFNQDAQSGAKHSNLVMTGGPAAILAYLKDEGENNKPVGHRRWLLRPTTNVMGIGDTGHSNALWVFGKETYPTQWSHWPPTGYFPSEWNSPRWSLTGDAKNKYNFSQARVSVTDSTGKQIPIIINKPVEGFAFDTLVWELPKLRPITGNKVETYTVEVTNIFTKDTYRVPNVTYKVKLFDPKFYERKTVERLSGKERISTSIALSQARYSDGSKPSITIATATTFPDALVGGAAAAWQLGPLLLTNKEELSPDVLAEIKRLGSTDFTILGGKRVISEKIVEQLRSLDAKEHILVYRLSGPDRYATSVAVAKRVFTNPSTAILVSGDSFGDAISAANFFGRQSAPLLLVNPKVEQPSAELMEFLETVSKRRLYIINGSSRVPETVLNELKEQGFRLTVIDGKDSYDANLRSAQFNYYQGASTVFLVTGTTFPDGLAAGPLVINKAGPIILVQNSCLPFRTAEYITNVSPKHIVLIGGKKAVPDSIGELAVCSEEP